MHERPESILTTPLFLAGFSTVALTSLFCSVVWPLATYTLTLAAFGLAHVLSELRYVHLRYGARLHDALFYALISLLVGVAGLRLAGMLGWLQGATRTRAELALVFLLILAVLPALWRQRRGRSWIAALAASAILGGLLVSPVHTLLALAVLHNWTPVGFLADATRGRTRRFVLGLCFLAFVVLPGLIATGLPYRWLFVMTGWPTPEASVLPVGPLADHLGAYLPRSLHGQPWALHAFSAVVFAQCLHYAVVIHVLPRLIPLEEREPESRQRLFWIGIVGVSLVLFVGFWLDFKQARAVYGILAAMHAWVELPILLVALLGALQRE